MGIINIEETREVFYTVGATPDDTFDIPFAFVVDEEIGVDVNGVAQSGLTVVGAGLEGVATRTVQLSAAVTYATVRVYDNTRPVRRSSFAVPGVFSPRSVDTELDRVYQYMQGREAVNVTSSAIITVLDALLGGSEWREINLDTNFSYAYGVKLPSEYAGVLEDTDDAAAAIGSDVMINTVMAVAADITFASKVRFVGRGKLVPAAGVTITFTQGFEADRRQVIDLSAAGSDAIISTPQTIFPEWYGSTGANFVQAFKAGAPGSYYPLLGKRYAIQPWVWNLDPTDPRSDTGKVIEGVTQPNRYDNSGQFFGTRLELEDASNDHAITMKGLDAANTYGAGGLRNLMLDCNKAGQTGGPLYDGIHIASGADGNYGVKDFEFHNLYVWDADRYGWNFNGNNNQIRMTGHIETWNCGYTGYRFAAVGDIQGSGTLVAVNNGILDVAGNNHGFYFGTVGGRFHHLYSYSNRGRGVFVDNVSPAYPVEFGYVRAEDNGLPGLYLSGKGWQVGVAHLGDNGQLGTGANRSGCVIASTAKGRIGSLIGAYRNSVNLLPGGARQEEYLLYDLGTLGCVIDYMEDQMVDAGYRVKTAYFTNNSSSGCTLVNDRPYVSVDYAVVNVATVVTPKPETYGRYAITNVTASMTVGNAALAQIAHGQRFTVQVTSTGAYNVNWNAIYVDRAGVPLTATALTAGQTVTAHFIRTGNKMVLNDARIIV